MSWASHRQSKYLLGVLLVCAVILFILIYPSLTKAPTCSDGKQDGTETGVDCGGLCDRMCMSDVSDPLVLWSRAFNISGSTYSLVAYVENQNKGAAVAQASYEFRVYDTNNLLIGRRDGTTFIPPNQEFAIFEPRFDAGQAVVKSTSFEFTTSPLIWVKKAPTIQTLPITVDHIVMGDNQSAPTLTAQVNNNSIYDLPPFNVVTILYDTNHNAISASETYNPGLLSNQSAPLLFTWPEAFRENVATKDILVEINPFTTSF
jgi:hypothetical protein